MQGRIALAIVTILLALSSYTAFPHLKWRHHPELFIFPSICSIPGPLNPRLAWPSDTVNSTSCPTGGLDFSATGPGPWGWMGWYFGTFFNHHRSPPSNMIPAKFGEKNNCLITSPPAIAIPNESKWPFVALGTQWHPGGLPQPLGIPTNPASPGSRWASVLQRCSRGRKRPPRYPQATKTDGNHGTNRGLAGEN